MSEVILSERLQSSISDKNLAKFESILAEDSNLIVRLKPRIINDILVQCIKISTSSNENSDFDGIEFIEAFMLKFHLLKCYFVFSDDTCKSVVQLYIERNRQFSPHSVNFLLRCHDLELVKRVFEQNLVSDKCSGDCANWHLMFVASYQERFFTHYFDTIFEGFLARFIMICKLRCSLTQKRFFLTWFAGSLHLYTDEWFLQNEETRFKFVLVKLFESLILNGLLTNSDFVNLSQMLAKRNKELISTKQYSKVGMFQSSNDERKPTNDGGQISQELPSQTAVLGQKPTATLPISYFPILEGLFPLSLKNNCRLAIKRAMVKYNKNEIDKLPLPANLKRFVYFENECESIYKCFDLINNKK